MNMRMRRAYHFVSASHGLDNIRRRRLKIALLDQLNDPFELWAVAQSDPKLRWALRRMKEEMARQHGVLCFSLDWQNPVMWSHYADRHRGVALGFDVDRTIVKSVSYVKTRPVLKEVGFNTAQRLLFTKYEDWHYEREARIYTDLKDKDPDTGFYFGDFGEQLVLREVIAGPLCTLTEQQLRQAAGPESNVRFMKARLAFRSFSVVEDLRGFCS